jgi:hypothetical protein
MACVGGGNNNLPCTGAGDCPGGSCEANEQSCDKLGQIVATIGDGTFDPEGGNTRFRIPQRSTTGLETNPADASCDPTDTFDPGEIQITRFDLVLEPTTGKSSSEYVDSPDDADDLALCGAGPAFPFQTQGTPDRPGDGAIVAATGTALSGGAPLYDLMYSSLTPLTTPVKVADIPMCTAPPAGCPE